jgi:cytochrome P450
LLNIPPSLTLTAADQREHARIRKLLNPAFSDSALLDQEKLLNKYFELLVRKLNEKIDGPSNGRVDMMAQYNFVAFDIIRYVRARPCDQTQATHYNQVILRSANRSTPLKMVHIILG